MHPHLRRAVDTDLDSQQGGGSPPHPEPGKAFAELGPQHRRKRRWWTAIGTSGSHTRARMSEGWKVPAPGLVLLLLEGVMKWFWGEENGNRASCHWNPQLLPKGRDITGREAGKANPTIKPTSSCLTFSPVGVSYRRATWHLALASEQSAGVARREGGRTLQQTQEPPVLGAQPPRTNVHTHVRPQSSHNTCVLLPNGMKVSFIQMKSSHPLSKRSEGQRTKQESMKSVFLS